MAFDQSFQRVNGVPSPPPALGSDPDPTTLTGGAAAAYATRDNCFTFQLQQAGPQPLHLALAATFAGTGTPGLVTVALYLYDATQTGLWLALPTPSPTLTLGEVVVADVPVVMSVLSQSWTIALVVSVASPAVGVYTIEAGLSESAVTPSGGAGAGSATAANQVTQIGLETTTAAETATTAAETTATAASVASIDSKTPPLVGGAVPVEVASLPLPTGAATSAAQASQLAQETTTATKTTATAASVASIDGKTPALVAGAVPVAGIGTAGTPAGGVASVQGVSGGTPIPISGAPNASIPSLADITLTNGVVTTPGSLPGGTTGICVTAHPNNATASILRVSDGSVSATQGLPLVPKASIVLAVGNASVLRLTAEAGGGGTGVACLSAV